MRWSTRFSALVFVAALPLPALAQRGGNGPFPGGENPDGSLSPSARLTRLFSQDAYTEYALLAPGTEQFRIRFLTEETRAGATELVNATRGGSEGTDVEVYDPRTGKALPFTYDVQGETHAIHAKLTAPVPAGGIGRVLIYKTYKDARTYQVYNEANPQFGIQEGDISWVRSLAGYRLGVILPKGYAFLSSNVAAQVSTLPDGRLELHFANPSGLSNPFTCMRERRQVEFTPTSFTDMFFDDVKTLYDLGRPADARDSGRADLQRLPKGRQADRSTCSATRRSMISPSSTSTPRSRSRRRRRGSATVVKLDVPIDGRPAERAPEGQRRRSTIRATRSRMAC